MSRNGSRARARHAACCGLLAGLITGLQASALGQGTADDYRRASELRKETTGRVRNEKLAPTWLSDHELIYRRQVANGGWAYVAVNARSGHKHPAFDHPAAAAALTRLLGRNCTPDRLPLDRIIKKDDKLLALVERDLRVVTLPTTGRELSEMPLETIDALILKPVTDRRSRDRGGDTAVLFANRSKQTVKAIWLDRGGQPKPYHTLKPGETKRQHTYAGHVWRIESEDGTELGTYQATTEPAVIVIDGEIHTPKPRPKEEKPTGLLSPDGRQSAFIKTHNVMLKSTRSGEERALTSNGHAEDAYQARMWWSPDSRWLAVIREQTPQQHTVAFVESAPDDQVQPKLHTFQYLKPGDRIARPSVVIFNAETGANHVAEGAPQPWSLTHFQWLKDSSELTFVYNQRGHQRLKWLAVNPSTMETRILVEEQSETFVDYASKLFVRVLPETNEAVWMSERDGWNHLYLVDIKDGRVKRQLTHGQWLVRSVEHVDTANRELTFRAMGIRPGEDPYHIHHGRVSLDGGDPVWLTHGDGTHVVTYSPDRSTIVATWSRVDHPPVHELRRASDGSLICELERADWSDLLATGWRPPERFVAKGRDGKTDIHGILFLPSNFDAKKRYPVIENIYAGPHSHFVPKRFSAWHGSREVSELGFVVARCDGMGTNWRSRAFHEVCWKNLGDSGFPDRMAWLKAAAKIRPFMDLDRVGIYGGSAGGQSALRAMLSHGDFYKAAVADCGCHDNRMDKIWWNELWMGWPIGEHYAEQSNVTQAHKLTGKLLLIVGALDRNVDPASTMQVVDALIKADKDFELLVMPSAGHGAAETPYGKRRRQDFFVRHLLNAKPRR